MHERIKWYALKQTTRSLWITVPTSEPFIFLLACNQADLVCTCWWLYTTDWPYKVHNLLRKKKIIIMLPKQEKGWFALKMSPKVVKKNTFAHMFFGHSFLCLIQLTVSRFNQLQTEKQNRENEYLEEVHSIRHRALMTHQILKKCLLEPWIPISDRLPLRLSLPMNEYFISENKVALRGTITKL